MQNYIGMRVNAVTVNWQTVPFLLKIIYPCPKDLTAGNMSTILKVRSIIGFGYPQHFSRMFKKLDGVTPSEYCQRVRI